MRNFDISTLGGKKLIFPLLPDPSRWNFVTGCMCEHNSQYKILLT